VVYEADQARVEERVFPVEHVFLINSILSDPNAQCLTFGCGGLSIPGHKVAVKTGTSEPFDPIGPNGGMIGETWAFGYTQDVVVGIWAGNSDNAPITNLTSTSIAFRAMRDMVLRYYQDRPSTPFVAPEGVRFLQACFVTPIRNCVADYFLESSMQSLGVVAPPASPLPPRPAPPAGNVAPSQPVRSAGVEIVPAPRQTDDNERSPPGQRRGSQGNDNRGRGRDDDDDD
jgi:membrane peptidoglycan carboxypeptidase